LNPRRVTRSRVNARAGTGRMAPPPGQCGRRPGTEPAKARRAEQSSGQARRRWLAPRRGSSSVKQREWARRNVSRSVRARLPTPAQSRSAARRSPHHITPVTPGTACPPCCRRRSLPIRWQRVLADPGASRQGARPALDIRHLAIRRWSTTRTRGRCPITRMCGWPRAAPPTPCRDRHDQLSPVGWVLIVLAPCRLQTLNLPSVRPARGVPVAEASASGSANRLGS
jgi:hypothetical protein